MKFFLVISIIAFWWVPLNSPGNIGILKTPLTHVVLQSKPEEVKDLSQNRSSITKRKMDHFDLKERKYLLNKEID